MALAAKFTQKRTVTKERTPDAIRVPVAHRPVVGLEVLAVVAKAGLIQTQRLAVANAVVIRIVVAERVA